MTPGRRATLPTAGYIAAHRRRPSSDEVTIFPEDGSAPLSYSVADFPLEPELRHALADAFAAHFGPAGPSRSRHSVPDAFASLRRVAFELAASTNPPRRPRDLSKADVNSLRLARLSDYRRTRAILRGMPELSPAVVEYLRAPLPKKQNKRTQSLTRAAFRGVMTAARADVSEAQRRIHAHRERLADWVGPLPARFVNYGYDDVLAFVAAHDDLPRMANGHVHDIVRKLGRLSDFVWAFGMTPGESTAGAVLLAGLTGQNRTPISELTVEHHRADGDAGGTPVAVVDMRKPRRGSRSEMTVPFTDVPDWVLEDADDEPVTVPPARALRSAFGVYSTLADLGSANRAATGTSQLLIAWATKGGRGRGAHWQLGVTDGALRLWLARHGLTPADGVTFRSIRQTYVELHQRGVAHTDRTLADNYLMGDRTHIAEYQQVVADALAERVKAAEDFPTKSLTAAEVDLCRTDPERAAAQLGITADVATGLGNGELDTVLTACVDNRDSPHGVAGQPCRASFFLCLSCKNARATPDHVGVQGLTRQRLLQIRPGLQPLQWAKRFAGVESQLSNILEQFPPAFVDQAMASVSPEEARAVDALLSGQLDRR